MRRNAGHETRSVRLSYDEKRCAKTQARRHWICSSLAVLSLVLLVLPQAAFGGALVVFQVAVDTVSDTTVQSAHVQQLSVPLTFSIQVPLALGAKTLYTSGDGSGSFSLYWQSPPIYSPLNDIVNLGLAGSVISANGISSITTVSYPDSTPFSYIGFESINCNDGSGLFPCEHIGLSEVAHIYAPVDTSFDESGFLPRITEDFSSGTSFNFFRYSLWPVW